MTLPIKSILSSLVILAMASDIHTQKIEESGPAWPLASSRGKTIVLGGGVDPSLIPIIAYSLASDSFYVSVYIQVNRKCDFTFSGLIGQSIEFQIIKQLTINRVLFAWSVANTDVDITTVSTFDMDNCARKSFEIRWALSSPKFVAIVPFADGFDVIHSDNSRTSYDINGNLMKKGNFPINSSDFVISAVSEKSRNDGFFIVNKINTVLNLADIDGKSFKYLLNVAATQVFSNNEQSLYSLCSYDTLRKFVVHCYQYGKDGTEKWRNTVTIQFRAPLDVKNLAGGGLAFIALNSLGNQLCVVEMGPTQVHIWNSPTKQTFDAAKLISFNQRQHTFVLAYATTQGKQQTAQQSVISQRYSLLN